MAGHTGCDPGIALNTDIVCEYCKRFLSLNWFKHKQEPEHPVWYSLQKVECFFAHHDKLILTNTLLHHHHHHHHYHHHHHHHCPFHFHLYCHHFVVIIFVVVMMMVMMSPTTIQKCGMWWLVIYVSTASANKYICSENTDFMSFFQDPDHVHNMCRI